MGRWQRMIGRIAQTKAGGWLAVHVASRIDPTLLKLSRGRFSIFVGAPIALLTHTGAKSGQKRETPLLYLQDGDRVVLTASKAGNPKHPAWFHNVRANPDVHLLTLRGSADYRAHVASAEERAELWPRVNELYAGYDVYQDRTGGREIPLVICEPRAR